MMNIELLTRRDCVKAERAVSGEVFQFLNSVPFGLYLHFAPPSSAIVIMHETPNFVQVYCLEGKTSRKFSSSSHPLKLEHGKK